MTTHHFNQTPAYEKLKQHSKKFNAPELHLKHLIEDPDRLENFSLRIPGFFQDFSRQRVNTEVMGSLHELARETGAKAHFSRMVSGELINNTEKRAALHTAARNFRPEQGQTLADGAIASMQDVFGQIKIFSDKIRQGELKSASQQKFTDAVIIGIGGSYLGCQFVYEALKLKIPPKIKLHFLSNVDIDNFAEITTRIKPETCLWIVVSKSYTTTETMANLNQVTDFLCSRDIPAEKHLISITAKGSPGDSSDGKRLASFHMFDFIGGRYSVTSAVGALPLALAFGSSTVEEFLDGCRKMDHHAATADEHRNIPLTAALLSIWNSNFLNYNAQGIIPYCSALSKLSPHVQQLYMESLGKNVTREGKPVDYMTGVIIFGEPGTNAQHSFFQLAHQGQPFPIEFIGVVQPVFTGKQVLSKDVTNHQELWANLIAQAQALAVGKTSDDPARQFSGNRPSTTLLINRIDPAHIGMLLAYYEARTAFEGFILGLNPFDQFGVELGKVLASGIRDVIAQKNRGETQTTPVYSIADFYIQTLMKGQL